MSVLLYPQYTPEITAMLTTASAVAVAKSIEKVSDKHADIKWINDVYIKGKKVCGILCESSFSNSNPNKVEYVVVGIGINLCNPKGDFPKEIRQTAASVFEKIAPDDKTVCMLCAEIVNSLLEYSSSLSERSFLCEYKKRLFMLGKEINVITPNETYRAVATDIDDEAHLIVTLPDLTKKTLSAGEISIRSLE